MEASHYRVCLQLMESCAHLAACNGVDAVVDLRPCVIVAGAHHWQLMPVQVAMHQMHRSDSATMRT